MRQYRERPRCRKIIEQTCDDYGWSLQELYEFTQYSSDCLDWRPVFLLIGMPGVRMQLRKMLQEQNLEDK